MGKCHGTLSQLHMLILMTSRHGTSSLVRISKDSSRSYGRHRSMLFQRRENWIKVSINVTNCTKFETEVLKGCRNLFVGKSVDLRSSTRSGGLELRLVCIWMMTMASMQIECLLTGLADSGREVHPMANPSHLHIYLEVDSPRQC